MIYLFVNKYYQIVLVNELSKFHCHHYFAVKVIQYAVLFCVISLLPYVKTELHLQMAAQIL